MKKIILIAILAIAAITSRQTLKAQITLEHTYDSANLRLYMVNLEVEGEKYIWLDEMSWCIKLYNLDHSLFKVMNYPVVSIFNGSHLSILYVSEHLFNTDDLIEFMFVYQDGTTNWWNTRIYNELGTLIFSADSLAPLIPTNWPQAQLPIYNTTNGTKMILGSPYLIGVGNVYSLTGTLTNSIGHINYNNYNDMALENSYPNPSNGNTTIEFHLPQGVNAGEIVVYNIQGMELKRYQVDNTFHNLLISNSDLHSGTYFYQLHTATGATGAKKMVVIK